MFPLYESKDDTFGYDEYINRVKSMTPEMLALHKQMKGFLTEVATELKVPVGNILDTVNSIQSEVIETKYQVLKLRNELAKYNYTSKCSRRSTCRDKIYNFTDKDKEY